MFPTMGAVKRPAPYEILGRIRRHFAGRVVTLAAATALGCPSTSCNPTSGGKRLRDLWSCYNWDTTKTAKKENPGPWWVMKRRLPERDRPRQRDPSFVRQL